MKLKVKFDSQSIQEFFIHHTEKIVFGSMFLVMVLLVYSAMGREQLSFQPDQLAKWAEDAERHIQSTPPGATRKPVDYLAIGNKIKTPIEEQLYQHVAIWDQPLFERKELRPGPPLLPVEELRVAAGHGGIPKNGSGGGGMMMEPGMSEMGSGMPGMPTGPSGPTGEGLRWVVLTGLVPDAKQREEALAAFQGTEAPSPSWDRRQDIPEVIYYKVERAEVLGEGDHQRQLAWTPLHLRNAMVQAQQFRSNVQEVVDQRFLRNPPTAYMAFPLPPVANHTWGDEVAHPPLIPLGRMNQYGMMSGEPGMPGMPGMPTAKPKPKPDTPTAKPVTELPDAPMLGPGGQGFGPGMMGPGMGSMEPGSPMPMMGMGSEGMPMMGSFSEGAYPPGSPESPSGMMAETRVRLFRFFDFTVEPGKRYKYRVKLMFTNPNLGLPIRILKSPEMATQKVLEAEEWSETREIVTVPRDSRVLAGPVKPSIWSTVEPKGTIGIAFFDMKSGAQQFEEFKDVMRGQLLNFTGRPLQGAGAPASAMTPEMDPMMMGVSSEMPPDMMYSGEKMAKKPKRTKPAPTDDKGEKVDYFTETILLDMCGGAKLPGRDRESTEPGRYLLFDPEGNLAIFNELDFEAEFKTLVEAKTKPKPMMGYGSEMPMGMEGSPPEMMPGGIYDAMPTEGGGRRKPPSRRGGP